MAKMKNQNKKKIDWKKVLTLVVIVALIVLKLMYDSDGGEDGNGHGGSNISTESSAGIESENGGGSGASLPVEGSSAGVTDEPESIVTSKPADVPKTTATPAPTATPEPEIVIPDLSFRNDKLLEQHYEKHGIDMGFASPEEYEAAACMVIANPDTLHKIEAEDGDDVYYLESTNEFVVVSKDGYIRTYFLPSAGIDYYNRQ